MFNRKAFFIVAGALLLAAFAVSFASALAPQTTVLGGTGTSSPSGILYGSGSSNPLKTVQIGSNLSFSGGALSATDTSFSTTSADFWSTQRNFFSTTSASYFLSQNQEAAFSTTSATYFLNSTTSTGFSTTSANLWASFGLAFSTTSTNYLLNSTTTTGFSTTSANFWRSIGLSFSTTSSDYWGSTKGYLTAAITSIGNFATTTGPAVSLSTTTTSFNGLTFGQTIGVSGSGITFTPTVTGTLSNGGLANSSVTVTAGTGLAGGGAVSLGSSITVYDTSSISTSSADTRGQLAAWGTTNGTPASLFSVATNTGSCSGTVSCSQFTIIGTSPITITGSAGTAASSTLLSDFNTFSNLTRFTNGFILSASSSFITLNGTAATTTSFFTTTASSTNSYSTNATTSSLYITGQLSKLLSTDASGQVLGTTVNSPLSFSANALSCSTCALTTRLINTTYPLQGGGDLSADRTLTLAFGTTTTNIWGALNTFNLGAILAASSSFTTLNGVAATSTALNFTFASGTNATTTRFFSPFASTTDTWHIRATSTYLFASSASTTNFASLAGTSTWWRVDNILSMPFAYFNLTSIGLGSTTPSILWGVSIGTTTVFQNTQFAGSISSSTANSATPLVNWDTGNQQRIVLQQTTCVVINSTSSNPRDGAKYILDVCQDNTGGRALTFCTPGQIVWFFPDGSATPTLKTTANTMTSFGMTYDSKIARYLVRATSTSADTRACLP